MKVRIVQVFFSVTCILGMSVVSFLLLIHPYVSMGIVAQMGQLPARVDNDKSYILLTIIIGRHKLQRPSCCIPKRGRIHL